MLLRCFLDEQACKEYKYVGLNQSVKNIKVTTEYCWIKIFPEKPVTHKPMGVRMGKGKGALEYWVAVVKPGRVLFEISGVPEDVAKEALRLATHKLPCKCKVVSRADLEGGESNEN